MLANRLLSLAFFFVGAFVLASCSSNEGVREHGGERSGEHGGGEGGEGGEESGTQFGLEDTYDHTRNGARLELRYDRDGKAFVGTVQNTTKEKLERVRVEVHLSNGVELGPTEPGDLGPGQKREVRLAANGQRFEKWSAHPEVGNNEHGHGSEGEGHR